MTNKKMHSVTIQVTDEELKILEVAAERRWMLRSQYIKYCLKEQIDRDNLHWGMLDD